jgi:hypothetical protein
VVPEQSDSFICETCGESHAGSPTDTGYTLPDDVWSIPEAERASQAKWTSDLCQMGERYFIRCLLRLPFIDRESYYGWGVWAEVDWATFKRYLDVYDSDATNEPVEHARLANDIPTYDSTRGLPISVQFGTSTARPTISFSDDQLHKLAIESRTGLSEIRYHEILVSRGVAR